MLLKLYRIHSTLIEHPDFTARLKKRTNEIFSYFSFGNGDEEVVKKNLEFIAGTGYTLENIEKTDYIDCCPPLLFSKKFVERIGDELNKEMQFIPCKLLCQGVILDWYAARIVRDFPILDKEMTTYSIVSSGQKVVRIPKYRHDIQEKFFIARDEEYIPYWVVSELFMDLCNENGLAIEFCEV